MVDPVNFLEAGLVFQAEHQDDSIHPAGKLEGGEEGGRKRRRGEHIAHQEQADEEA